MFITARSWERAALWQAGQVKTYSPGAGSSVSLPGGRGTLLSGVIRIYFAFSHWRLYMLRENMRKYVHWSGRKRAETGDTTAREVIPTIKTQPDIAVNLFSWSPPAAGQICQLFSHRLPHYVEIQ